jgi:KDO2-lipid IV(A) lauroyltransferase
MAEANEVRADLVATASRSVRAKDAAIEWVFATGWRLVKVLPERAAFSAFDQAADVLWRRRGGGVIQFEKNQARVHPEASASDLRELSRLGMRSYLRYWCEAFRLPTMGPDEVRGRFDLERKELMDAAVESGTGAVMVVNHGGNWDLAGAWGCLRYGGLTTVAERLKPEGLFELFLEYRQSLGMNVVPLGDPDVIRRLARALKQGQIVPLLGDRDISRSGVVVDFFGEPASLPAGPAVLGMMTGAPVMPVTLWYDGPLATGYIHDPIPVPAEGTRSEKIQVMIQGIANAHERKMRDHSVDWHMMQPVWLADLDPERRRA